VRFSSHGLFLRCGQQLRCLAAHGNTILGRSDGTRLSGNDAHKGNCVDGLSIATALKWSRVYGSFSATALKWSRVYGSFSATALKWSRVYGSFSATALNASDVQSKHCLADHQTSATHQEGGLARKHRRS
jgi:outer membrane scaffolding protein for murein synthesis (MipA/OmpV family)